MSYVVFPTGSADLAEPADPMRTSDALFQPCHLVVFARARDASWPKSGDLEEEIPAAERRAEAAQARRRRAFLKLLRAGR